MYFYVGLVGILRPLHSPSYLGSQDRLFVISAFCLSAFWHIGFLPFGISAFWHIGFFAYRLITYRVFAASAYCISAFYEGWLDRLFVISAFCFWLLGFLSYRLFVYRLFCISAFCISAFCSWFLVFCHIGFLSYRLFVLSAFWYRLFDRRLIPLGFWPRIAKIIRPISHCI
jgi:hypothetical protein